MLVENIPNKENNEHKRDEEMPIQQITQCLAVQGYTIATMTKLW